MRHAYIIFVLLLLPAFVLGAIDVYEFESPTQRERFEKLTAELRCPKCQNQNIAGSDAPIAADMRERVYQRLMAGQSDEEIIRAMVDRFGEFVRFRPPLNSSTLLLWFGPVLLALVGILIIVMIVRRNRQTSGPVLSVDEHARVNTLLSEADHPRHDRDEAR